MHCLYLPDGRVTCELYEKKEVALDFYETLYLAEDCDPVAEVFLEGLPQLSSTWMSELNSPATFQEVSETVAQVCLGIPQLWMAAS